MTDIEKARQLFRDAGLAFPTIPQELAEHLKEQGRWLFSTRPIGMSPYNLQHYVDEIEVSQVEDYAVLSHSGHGVNSYAIQYYLVYGSLRMFLHLGWGGVYTDRMKAAAAIRDCFSMADQIASLAQTVGQFQAGERLLVVGSDFYGSYWFPPGKTSKGKHARREGPLDILTEVYDWLTRQQSKRANTVGRRKPVMNITTKAKDAFRRSFSGVAMGYTLTAQANLLPNIDESTWALIEKDLSRGVGAHVKA